MINSRIGTGTSSSNSIKGSPQPTANSKTATTAQRLGQATNFGPFTLDPGNALLRRNNDTLPLTPKAFSVLCYLIDYAGQLVSKEEIFDAIWPRSVVTDSALTVCIREIRKVLGDTSKNPAYIETAHKRGYRFIGKIRQSSESHPSPRLVGRDLPLATLHACYEEATTGNRQVVFITGEAGIGKTTLLENFIANFLAQADCRVARGQCMKHYGSREAYLPLLDALGRLSRKQDEKLSEILALYAPSWLAHLPVLHNKLNRPGLPQVSETRSSDRMMREIAEALEAICQLQPLVLCLEDLHWGDLSTTDLVSFLARRHDPARLLIISTFRYNSPRRG